MNLIISEYIITAVLSIYGIIKVLNWRQLSFLHKSFASLAIIGAILICWNSISEHRKKNLIEKIESSFVILENDKNSEYPIFQVASTDTRLHVKNGVFISTSTGPLFKAYVKNNRLYFSSVIYNRKGELIAAIYENECTRYNSDYEYNNDDNGYEIVTKGEREIFCQIDLKNGVAIIAGFFYSKNGIGIKICKAPDLPGMLLEIIDAQTLDNTITPCASKRLFKYPRDVYFGKRDL